jgi:hypothetical protein
MIHMEEFVKIAVLDYAIQAQLLEIVLTDRNIPHYIRSYYDNAYGGLFQFQKGWGHVEAPEAYKQEILDILKELNKEPIDD